MTHNTESTRPGALALAYFEDMPANWNPQEAGAATDLRALIAERDALKAHAAALAGAIEHAANVLDEPVDEATAERLQISLRRTLSENGGGK